jgi:HPt (histidine-containing phosphotransfer) domain-containing protein
MSRVETAIYDKAEVLVRLGGDESLFSELTQLFVTESTAYCHALEGVLLSADAARVQREAHSVKSVLATFSYEEGREIAMRLEHLAASGRLGGADRLTAQVLSAVRRLAAVFAKI